jgi:hypothetical protein
MRNFDKKVKYLFNLHMYRFKEYNYETIKLKFYIISADDRHTYLSIDNVYNEQGLFQCEIGDLFFDHTKNKLFEDTPNETVYLNKIEYKTIKKFYDKTPDWSNKLIKDIMKLTDKLDLDLAN